MTTVKTKKKQVDDVQDEVMSDASNERSTKAQQRWAAMTEEQRAEHKAKMIAGRNRTVEEKVAALEEQRAKVVKEYEERLATIDASIERVKEAGPSGTTALLQRVQEVGLEGLTPNELARYARYKKAQQAQGD